MTSKDKDKEVKKFIRFLLIPRTIPFFSIDPQMIPLIQYRHRLREYHLPYFGEDVSLINKVLIFLHMRDIPLIAKAKKMDEKSQKALFLQLRSVLLRSAKHLKHLHHREKVLYELPFYTMDHFIFLESSGHLRKNLILKHFREYLIYSLKENYMESILPLKPFVESPMFLQMLRTWQDLNIGRR